MSPRNKSAAEAKKHTKGRGRRQNNQKTRKGDDKIPALAKDTIRVIPLGGVEEVGKNMTLVEYGEEIVIIDAGFQFSEEDMPGIDFLIPDVTYLEKNKAKIKGLFITHGHYDHIGAIPHIMNKIGNPPIYTKEFGAAVIKKRQTEFTEAPEPNIRIVRDNQNIKVSKDITIETFDISHAIPDSMGIIVHTPIGEIVFISDIRVDHVNDIPTKEEEDTYKIFKDRDVLLFTLDSTGIEKPGFNVPESKAIETVVNIMKNTPGRLIIATFASQIDRVVEFVKGAEKLNKKVIIEGRSMKTNVEIAKELGILSLKNIIPIEEMADYPADKIVIIATGAQGEEYSVLDRVVHKKHKHIKLNENDTVILSSSVIPGNEHPITKLKDNLYRTPAKIITYREEEVHASGHGARGELKWIHEQVPYKYFMPVHGNHYMLKIHKEVAVEELGVPKENVIVPDNGSIIEIDKNKNLTIRKEKAPTSIVMVDGFDVGDKHQIVVRDRQMLAEDGFVVIVATVNTRTGKLRKSPDIISRGFVYLRDNQELLDQTRLIIKRSVEGAVGGQHPINFDYVKKEVTDEVRKFLYQQTAKNPIVIPVVLGV